jgi:TonB family protein
MNNRLRHLLLGTGLAAAACFSPMAAAAESAPAATATPAAPPPQRLLLRVTVNASGRVTSAQSLDPRTPNALVRAADEIASKLQFTPATKNGAPIASETSLSMTLGMVPKSTGGFALSLLRAQNGPSIVEAHTETPNVSREVGGIVVVGVDLLPGGVTDMKTFKHESTQLRTPSSFGEQRFIEAARKSLKDARFMLDKVDGIEVPSRISVPFQFNGGMRKPVRGDDEEGSGYGGASTRQRGKDKDAGAPEDANAPSLTAVSRIEGITLPKIDFRAPPAK